MVGVAFAAVVVAGVVCALALGVVSYLLCVAWRCLVGMAERAVLSQQDSVESVASLAGIFAPGRGVGGLPRRVEAMAAERAFSRAPAAEPGAERERAEPLTDGELDEDAYIEVFGGP